MCWLSPEILYSGNDASHFCSHFIGQSGPYGHSQLQGITDERHSDYYTHYLNQSGDTGMFSFLIENKEQTC